MGALQWLPLAQTKSVSSAMQQKTSISIITNVIVIMVIIYMNKVMFVSKIVGMVYSSTWSVMRVILLMEMDAHVTVLSRQILSVQVVH
jgi:hypothetical protein